MKKIGFCISIMYISAALGIASATIITENFTG